MDTKANLSSIIIYTGSGLTMKTSKPIVSTERSSNMTGIYRSMVKNI
ncbi:MAG: hypothetical protein R6U96_02315 [Promethearchaeia archaeon]